MGERGTVGALPPHLSQLNSRGRANAAGNDAYFHRLPRLGQGQALGSEILQMQVDGFSSLGNGVRDRPPTGRAA